MSMPLASDFPHAISINKMYDTCVHDLHTFCEQTHASSLVVGLSGGIDSALCACMAVDALGASQVTALLLPGPFSSDASRTDAYALANILHIQAHELSIVPAYQALSQPLSAMLGTRYQGVPNQNVQARLRMVALMAFSNACDALLLNTGNKTEALMGYSTLYGDTAGAFAPLGGLYKTSVYALARLRGVPEAIIEKAPSAELAPHHFDEDALGFSYAQLDAFLVRVYDLHMSAHDAAREAGLSPDEGDSIVARVEQYAYKRALEPPYPQHTFYA